LAGLVAIDGGGSKMLVMWDCVESLELRGGMYGEGGRKYKVSTLGDVVGVGG